MAKSGWWDAARDRVGPVTVLVTRSFPAPDDALFRAWTEPAVLAQWWDEGRTTVRALEPRRGGGIHVEMFRGGAPASEIGSFREVTPPMQIVFSLGTRSPGPGMGAEVLYTVTFAEHELQTHLVLQGRTMDPSVTPCAVAALEQAWERRLDRLGGVIAGLKTSREEETTTSAAENNQTNQTKIPS